MNKPYGWVDEINTFVLDKDYRQLPKSLQNGMTPLYANKVPDGLIDPKSFYEGYENGKKSQRAKLENRLGITTVIKSLEYKSSPPNTKKGTREMNANELADKLEEVNGWFDETLMKEAATMLRQQQSHIESLQANELSGDDLDEFIRSFFNIAPTDSETQPYPISIAQLKLLVKQVYSYHRAINNS